MGIIFDQPIWLLAALLGVVMAIMSWRATVALDPVRRVSIVITRLLLCTAIAVVLAGPSIRREHDGITVIGVVDMSGSMRRFASIPTFDEDTLRDVENGNADYAEAMRQWFEKATESRLPDDRFGMIVFDGDATIISAPTRADHQDRSLDVRRSEGTNIEEALRLAIALFPAGDARRVVLVSDGAETAGRAVSAVREAAGQAVEPTPIDVLPVEYRVERDAQILRLETPATARPDQVIETSVVISATRPMDVDLFLRREGQLLDLDSGSESAAIRLRLPAGDSAHRIPVRLGVTPINRLSAQLRPVNPDDDQLPENNQATAVVSTPADGGILVVTSTPDSNPPPGGAPIARELRAADFRVISIDASEFPRELLSLQDYDLLILDDIPASALTTAQQDMIARHVEDLGGGLITLGGTQTYGLGGWKGTALAEILPVLVDPPPEMILPKAAIVLVIDRSGSMNQPVSGTGMTQQRLANESAAIAIESLRSETLVGVVSFSEFASTVVPLQQNVDAQAIGQRVRGIQAGGGTDIRDGLTRAAKLLEDVDVDQKYIVCLSDGRSPTDGMDELVKRLTDDDVVITTIAVGDGADHELLAGIADQGDGMFFPVYNPRRLPRVLVDSVQIVNQSLLKTGTFAPQIVASGNAINDTVRTAPTLGGIVVTADRPDPRARVDLRHPEGEPVLAQWQAGLGRVATFTSDFGGNWSTLWTTWNQRNAFWTTLARSTARPRVPTSLELMTTLDSGALRITLDASDEDGFLDALRVNGNVYGPSGDAIEVRLQQTGPGRYSATVPAEETGNYVIALSPRRGREFLAPVVGAATRLVGEEFRRYESNTALVEDVRRTSGGRALVASDPASADLYDRTDLVPRVALRPVWRPWLIAVFALFLLDVATRRIAWSWASIQSRIRLEMARFCAH